MGDEKIQDMLLELIKNVTRIEAKLDAIDEQRLSARIDALEAQNKEHDRVIKSLENRSSTMEQFTRNNILDTKKQQTSVFISMGLAIFSSILSIVMSILFK